jgi:hypothetical protein
VIPSLIEPYVRLLHETDSLRNLGPLQHNLATPACQGCSAGQKLKVSCVYFESTFLINKDR